MHEQTVKYGLKDVRGISGGIGCLVWGSCFSVFVLVVGYWYCGSKFCGGQDDKSLGTPISAFGGLLSATIITAGIHFVMKWNRLSELRRLRRHSAENHTYSEKSGSDPKKNDQAEPSEDAIPPTANPQKRSPYKVLGIQVGASPDEIRSAYKKAAEQNHPDKVAHLAPEFRVLAEDRMREINAAYEALRS
jgi:DnaJ-domain-containing protein 1